MSAASESSAVTYQLRRQSRGGTPPETSHPWRRRLLWSAAAVGLVAVVVLAGYFVWFWPYVTTIQASVETTVLELASHVDVRLLDLQVRPGDAVEAGQTLARLDDSELRQRVAAAEAERDIRRGLFHKAAANVGLTEQRVKADIDLARASVTVSEAQAAQAEAALAAARTRLADQIRRAQAHYEEAQARLALLEKGTRPEKIGAARARVAAAKAMVRLYTLEVEQSKQLVVQGIDSTHLLEVKKAQLATQDNRVREAQLDLDALLAGATDEERRIAEKASAARQAELALAKVGKTDVEGLAADVKRRRGEVDQAKAELARAQAMTAQIEIAREQAKVDEAEMSKAEAQLKAQQALLAGMVIASPVTGRVVHTLRHVGEICRKGEPLVLIADESEGYWVEAYIHEQDAPLVRPGQAASVEIMVGSGEYVEAEVEAVALATNSVYPVLAGQSGQGRPNPTSEFVWVKLRLQDRRPEWRPGMTAWASIRVR